ncbi:MAG: 16S rRNA (cytosine(1402)-N(4))-methyltransferase RsmH [Candidatus Sungbacteria bacterium]|nr:16S rRNA (cytosine(1402)-N(4))-methyltransferase RsmH [bacterium]MDZ4260406.1 16S rRNA (cytosine(1402)-N(4))-methyltransferase RsmH [Candidatus Sungbacteria bacterium]
MKEIIHTPVLLKEVLEIFNPQQGARYIDATVNGGGHAKEILERIGQTGELLGIDRDPVIVETLKKNVLEQKNFVIVCDSYARMKIQAAAYGFGSVNGILFDLGFSSYHVDQSGRGFSFQRDEPLDMRYNPKVTKLTAATIINTWSKNELERIFKEYGEERFSGRIAAGIITSRKERSFRTTSELVHIIRKNIPSAIQHGNLHPATKVFQALRIAVNDELGELVQGLEQGIDCLVKEGKMIIISFHSLEDGIVKKIFKNKEKEGIVRILTKKPIGASREEEHINPRSRSAKLRAIIKVN